jgi:hypothetical protein
MKILTPILSLIISSVALAEDPAELVKLRTIYDNSLRGEFQKVGKLYHKELLQLKKNYMQAENLEGAVAVDKEIKKLRETHGKMVVKAPESQETASPLDGAWILTAYGKKSVFVLNGGKARGASTDIGTIKHEKRLVAIEWESGWYYHLEVSEDNPNIMTGKNKSGASLKLERFKW